MTAVVYSRSPTSPYASSVARLLAQSGADVHLVTGTGSTGGHLEGVQVHRAWGSSRSVGEFSRRLAAPIRTVLLVGRPPGTLIVAFAGGWANLVFGAAARLGFRVINVVHNAGTSRAFNGRHSLDERWLTQASEVLVHEPAQLPSAQGLTRRPVHLARHPSVKLAEPGSDELRSRSVLFLGALRTDKGVHLLPRIARELASRSPGAQLWIVGMGNPSDLGDLVGDVVVDVRPDGVPADSIARALSGARVLVAPYHDVCASATVLAALGAGLGVVAFRSPSLERLLPPDSLVDDDVVALVRRAIDFLDGPWEMDVQMDDWDRRAADEWARAIIR